jgi:exopolysaccharide biosynthesis polyprenyl glycosylphosphotransferase
VVIHQLGQHQGTGSLSYLLEHYSNPTKCIGVALLAIWWISSFNVLVHYETSRLQSLKSQLFDVFKATSASAFLLMLVATVFSFRIITNEIAMVFLATTCTLGMLGRLLLHGFLMVVRSSGYNYRHLIILGYNGLALRMAQKIDATPVLGYKIGGFISEQTVAPSAGPNQDANPRIIGQITDLRSILEKGPVDEIMICLPILEHFSVVSDVVRLAQELGIVVRLVPDQATENMLSRCHIEQFEGACIMTMFREQLLMQLLAKRLMDIVVSLLLLVLLGPLLAVVAVAIKLTSPGPILFVQERVGMNKRLFKLYKFRSMFMDAEKRRCELSHLNEMDGPVFKIKNDPRVTPVGRFIRATSIDELPQLVNVLRGQMSLVGPRPPLLEEVDCYEWLYRRRLSIKPGITCLWQISGRNEISFKQWMQLDQQYIDNWSLWLDIKILAQTVPAVLIRKGAS